MAQAFRDYNGQMDEFRVWDHARSEADILATKDQELTGSESGLMAYYDFNQGIAGGSNATETTLLDRANSYDGALTGFLLSGATSNWVGNGPSLSPPTPVDNALNFQPADYVNLANPADFNVGASTDFTIQGKIRTTFNTTTIQRCLFSKQVNNAQVDPVTGYQLWIINGKVNLEWAENGVINNVSGNAVVSDAECHHIAVTVDRSAQEVKFYVDGVS